MRFLAIDHGTRRVGLALGDTNDGTIVMLPSFSASGDRGVAGRIAKIVDDEDVERIVVGMPMSIQGGGGGAAAERVTAFLMILLESVDIPVDTEDERFTTAMVEGMRKDAGVHVDHFDKDSAAAVVIAESFLQKWEKKNRGR